MSIVQTEEKVYQIIRKNPGKRAADLSELMGISVRVIRYHLKSLCEQGRVRMIRNVLGDARSRVYYASEIGSADAVRTHLVASSNLAGGMD